MVTFNATVISNSTAIKSSKGVANAAEKQAETDNTLMLTSVQAGTMLTDVALFVDSDSDALAPEAKTERWGPVSHFLPCRCWHLQGVSW